MSYANGGFMTAWSDARYFKPQDGEKVIIHWSEGFIDVARYREQEDKYECEDLFSVKKINYWMRIPPIPQE